MLYTQHIPCICIYFDISSPKSMALHIEWVTTGAHNPAIQVWLELNSLEGVDVVSLPVRNEACLQNSIECRSTPGLCGVRSEDIIISLIVWIWHVVRCVMRGRRVWSMGALKSWKRDGSCYISMYTEGIYMYIHGIYMVYTMYIKGIWKCNPYVWYIPTKI